jgi:hypothetical protein
VLKYIGPIGIRQGERHVLLAEQHRNLAGSDQNPSERTSKRPLLFGASSEPF